jgi:phage-related protein
MTSKGSESRIKWEGDSNKVIRTWDKAVRENIGADLDRLEKREQPLDSKPMGKVLPGVSELRDEDKDFWYRVMYWLRGGWIYILHCFTKTTNQTSQSDIQIAKDRKKTVEARKDPPYTATKQKEEKSA